MVELDDVLGDLVDKTKNGDLKWQVDSRGFKWIATRHDCAFWVEGAGGVGNGLVLKVIWPFDLDSPGTRASVPIGRQSQIESLTDLLEEMYPFVAPPKPTTDDALQAASDCLQK